jgi:hypothetical protein
LTLLDVPRLSIWLAERAHRFEERSFACARADLKDVGVFKPPAADLGVLDSVMIGMPVSSRAAPAARPSSRRPESHGLVRAESAAAQISAVLPDMMRRRQLLAIFHRARSMTHNEPPPRATPRTSITVFSGFTSH